MTTKAVTCPTQRCLILNPTFLRLRTSMGLGKVTPTCHFCCCVISFFSVLPHNVCLCWICKLPNIPGVFQQPFSKELLSDLTLIFLCSQIWRTEGCFPGPSLWPFVVRLHIQGLHFSLTTFQPSWSSMCPWQLLATLSSERWQGLCNCRVNMKTCSMKILAGKTEV